LSTPAKCQENGYSIFELPRELIPAAQKGTQDNLKKSKEEFGKLSDNILNILKDY